MSNALPFRGAPHGPGDEGPATPAGPGQPKALLMNNRPSPGPSRGADAEPLASPGSARQMWVGRDGLGDRTTGVPLRLRRAFEHPGHPQIPECAECVGCEGCASKASITGLLDALRLIWIRFTTTPSEVVHAAVPRPIGCSPSGLRFPSNRALPSGISRVGANDGGLCRSGARRNADPHA